MRAPALATLVGGAVAAAAVVLVADGGSAEPTTAAGSTSTATATIARRDLVEIDTEDGTLGYTDARSVPNRLRGTVTWLPPAGRVVRPDRALYKVNDEPVVLLDGRVPAYRPLTPRTRDGTDVRQLERALRASGYDPDRAMTVDRSWDDGTTAAVRRWQRAHGLDPSGAIALGRVVFLPGTRRVATATARGLTTTSTRRQVTVALDTDKSPVAKAGARVTVVLPSDEKVRGRVASVGTVACEQAGGRRVAAGERHDRGAHPAARERDRARPGAGERALRAGPAQGRARRPRDGADRPAGRPLRRPARGRGKPHRAGPAGAVHERLRGDRRRRAAAGQRVTDAAVR